MHVLTFVENEFQVSHAPQSLVVWYPTIELEHFVPQLGPDVGMLGEHDKEITQ